MMSGKAYELLHSGDLIDAAEALRIGLVHRVVAPEALLPTVQEFAGRLAKAAPITLRLTKRALSHHEVGREVWAKPLA